MNKNKVLTSTLATLFLIMAGLGLGQYFLFNDIKTRTQKSSDFENTLLAQNEIIEHVNSTKAYLNSLSQESEKVNSYIIVKDGDVAFLEDMEDLAKSSNLTVLVESLTLEGSEELTNNGLTTLKIKIRTSGSWTSVYKFLSQIESLPFKVTIERVNLLRGGAKAEGVSSSTYWEGVFEVKVLKYI